MGSHPHTVPDATPWGLRELPPQLWGERASQPVRPDPGLAGWLGLPHAQWRGEGAGSRRLCYLGGQHCPHDGGLSTGTLAGVLSEAWVS